MSAEIVDFAQFRLRRELPPQAVIEAPMALAVTEPSQAPFQFWTGASGTRYVHSIYNLFECPPVDAANYILVKRHRDGQRTVLSIGRVLHASASMNLADVRQRSAELGANEIHVHLLADSKSASQQIEADLKRSIVIA